MGKKLPQLQQSKRRTFSQLTHDTIFVLLGLRKLEPNFPKAKKKETSDFNKSSDAGQSVVKYAVDGRYLGRKKVIHIGKILQTVGRPDTVQFKFCLLITNPHFNGSVEVKVLVITLKPLKVLL